MKNVNFLAFSNERNLTNKLDIEKIRNKSLKKKVWFNKIKLNPYRKLKNFNLFQLIF